LTRFLKYHNNFFSILLQTVILIKKHPEPTTLKKCMVQSKKIALATACKTTEAHNQKAKPSAALKRREACDRTT
jgi:hypothetical protein